MGLFRRGQRVWWMRFRHEGKLVKKSTKTTNRKLAQRILDKVKGDIAEGRWFERLPGEDKTCEEMMEKYLEEHSKKNKAPRSYQRDKSLRKHLVDFFGELPLVEITPSLIGAYKVKRREEGASPRTVNYELALMSHAFNLAIREWEWIQENPVKKVSKEKVNNHVERWLTFAEEKKLLESSSDWLKEIIIFAINTGLRQSEILDLKWPQVDLARRTITILEQKNQGRDTLPLNENAKKILEARRKLANGSEYVFYNGNSGRIDGGNLRRAFYSVAKKAKIRRLRFHDLRHTFATRLVQAGVDLYTVQKLGRWKNISMIMRYAHHYPESLRSGVEVLDKLGVEGGTKSGTA
jgi:integrase